MMQSGFACGESRPLLTGCEPRFWQHTRRGRKRMRVDDDAIRCDACPVLCYIKPGRAGACDRYANADGQLVRLDPHVVLERAVSRGDTLVPFLEKSREWDGALLSGDRKSTRLNSSHSQISYAVFCLKKKKKKKKKIQTKKKKKKNKNRKKESKQV